MTQNIDRAARDLFQGEERQTRDIKYFFRVGENSSDQLADYRTRAMAQIERGISVEDIELDRLILEQTHDT